MLEWTGERFLPWLKEPTIAYEHLHRYAYAARMVKDKRVLDLASGEGYGSKLLAVSASSVVGVDIDETTVRHATAKYGTATLQFLTGSMTAVPIPENQSFDVIVCFEAIEHIDEHEKLLGEVKRLLNRDGLFIVSTPNKAAYEEGNPFHVKELSLSEFRQLLGRHFKHVTLLGQRIHPHSNIWPLKADSNGHVEEMVIERSAFESESEFGFISNTKRVPLYVIALASDSRTPLPDSGSVLVDYSNELLNQKDQVIRELLETKASQEEALAWHESQAGCLKETVASLEQGANWRQGQLEDLENTIASQERAIAWYKSQVTNLENTVASRQEGTEWLEEQVAGLKGALDLLAREKTAVEANLTQTRRQLEDIYANPIRKYFRNSIFSSGSVRGGFFQKLMALVTSRGRR